MYSKQINREFMIYTYNVKYMQDTFETDGTV